MGAQGIQRALAGLCVFSGWVPSLDLTFKGGSGRVLDRGKGNFECRNRALLAAKAALVLEETPLGRSLVSYRRIVEIAAKVLFYGITCLLFLYAERVLEDRHKFHNWEAAFPQAYEQLSHSILVWSLGISIVFALYFVFAEISERMGQGELWRLFFEDRTNDTDSRRPSKIDLAKRRN